MATVQAPNYRERCQIVRGLLEKASATLVGVVGEIDAGKDFPVDDSNLFDLLDREMEYLMQEATIINGLADEVARRI